ncbi:MAG: P-protein [Phycisphaerae bacterium]|nr:P-protein [Phycisphaerae bacterium]
MPERMEPKTKPLDEMDLAELRVQIDRLDEQIVRTLNQRAEVVIRVGHIKNADGTPVYAPDREKQVLERIAAINTGPLPDSTLWAIYRELMSGSFALERRLRIGYLGPEGSFSHLGATVKFGQSVEYRPLPDIRTIFEEVARGHVDLGMVPVENSIGGGVIDTLDAFIELEMHICAEVMVAIHHNLLARRPVDKLEKIYSKPEVFTQCRRWLSANGLMDKTVPVASTSRAAEIVTGEESSGAIGSALAAKLYGLPIQVPNVEDNANNLTRFLVIGKESARPSGEDKTAIMFTTAHRSGALADVLDVFRRNGVNLTNIDTRPSKKHNWEYYFFVDCEGHREDENMIQAVEEAREHCLQLNVLGSFPRAKEIMGA